jgi:hypothetical protein
VRLSAKDRMSPDARNVTMLMLGVLGDLCQNVRLTFLAKFSLPACGRRCVLELKNAVLLSSSWIYASWAPADAGGGRRPGADAKGRASARGSGVWVTHGEYGIRYCCRTRGASSRLRTPRSALLSRSRTRSAYNSRNRRRFRNRRPPSTLTYNMS